MGTPIRVLIVEDRPADVTLALDELREAGFDPIWTHVETESDYLRHLDAGPEVILADYTLPQFNAPRALKRLQERGLDIPFLIVTGSISEETAVECVKAGADDYLLKDRLSRLGQAVRRALRDKQARAERRHASETVARQARLLELAGDAIFVRDLDGTINYWNAAAERLYGWSKAEALGQVSHRLLRTEGESLAQREATTLRDGYWHGELIHVARDGRRIVVASRWTLERDHEARPQAILEVNTDVTEQKRAEAERVSLLLQLEREHALLTEVLRQMPAGVIIAEAPSGRLLRGNNQIEAIFRPPFRPSSAVEQYHEWEGFHLDGRPVAPEDWPLARALRTGQVVANEEFEYLRGDGTRCYIEVSAAPIRDHDGNIVLAVATVHDITERKDAEAHRQQLAQADKWRALGLMAGGIAHDFNNPLAPILGYSELLLLRPETWADTERVRAYLGLINEGADAAAEVIRRLQEFYRQPDADEHFAPVELNELIEQVVALSQPKWKDQALRAGRTIEVRPDLEPVPVIHGHRGRLREALTNLVFNAVDAMPGGGTLTLRTRLEGAQVAVDVSDTGQGMPAEVRRRCLEPFFSTKGEQGTGLGLAMVYGIVQRHGGTLDITSEVGKGTTITMRLPVDTERPATVAPKPVGSKRALTILIVDDNPVVRDITATYLKVDGHRIEVASEGVEALACFRQRHIDLVITDQSMPGMSGDQLALAIKQLSPTTPVLLLTGFGDAMRDASDRPLGVDAVVAKPARLSALREALARLTGEVSG
jgi:PAS domain S-box-containing protein